MSRKIFKLLSLFLFIFPSTLLFAEDSKGGEGGGAMISVFDVDVSPEIGSPMAYDVAKKSWDLSLRARGIVISGIDQPIVLCSFDWIGVGNESQTFFKERLAKAAGTVPGRVSVHAIHQHDAPRSDMSCEKLLLDAGLDAESYDSKLDYLVAERLERAIEESLKEALPLTDIGQGEAPVCQVASNRRIFGKEGVVTGVRYSTGKTKALRKAPEGVIDPIVSLVSFWSGDVPVAVLSFYACHPQSYYRTGIANPDFPGVARFLRELEVPEALHVHFNGAGGDIAAGKYNDGSKVNRGILANRLADGMKRAWEATEKNPIVAADIDWIDEPVRLTPTQACLDEVAEWKKSKDNEWLKKKVRRVAFVERFGKQDYTVLLNCIKLGDVRILTLPGECFVDYQLRAKAARPDLFVAVAGYSEYAAGYIPTPEAYDEGGYEVQVTRIAPEGAENLRVAIDKIMNR